MNLMNPVSIHLKDLDRGEFWFFKQVIDLQVGVEGGTLGVESDSSDVKYVAAAHGCLLSAEVTEKKTYVGGCNMVQ